MHVRIVTYFKQNRCLNEQFIQARKTCKTNSDTNISTALFFPSHPIPKVSVIKDKLKTITYM